MEDSNQTSVSVVFSAIFACRSEAKKGLPAFDSRSLQRAERRPWRLSRGKVL